jgi:hypothetical protein
MARWENEQVDQLNLPEMESMSTELFDLNAKQTQDEKIAVAKKSKVENRQTFYIKHGRGEIYDPWGMDRNKSSSFIFSLRKVNEEIFNLYLEYLKTKREIFLTRARRLFINLGE